MQLLMSDSVLADPRRPCFSMRWKVAAHPRPGGKRGGQQGQLPALQQWLCTAGPEQALFVQGCCPKLPLEQATPLSPGAHIACLRDVCSPSFKSPLRYGPAQRCLCAD